MAGYEKALGPKHTSTLTKVHNLGMLYESQGKVAEEAMYERALVEMEKTLGPNIENFACVGGMVSCFQGNLVRIFNSSFV